MNREIKIAALSLVVAITIPVVYAQQTQPGNDMAVMMNARVPAVTIAEQHVTGKAVKAGYERTRQGWVYGVEVLSNGKAFDVRVDPLKGAVISAVEDKIDHDDEK